MNGYSYKQFMNKVKEKLADFSAEELRNLISEWAAEETPSNRQEFLNKLNVLDKKQIVEVDTDLLWDEVEAFTQDVENGVYCEGYGWDSDIMDEKDFGDESWAEEMDAFFLEARGFLREGDYKVGEAVYKKLFEILEWGEEPGYLPCALHPSDMLKIDLKEHVALFLRSVYMNTAHEARVNVLYTSMNEYEYLVSSKIKLADIIEAMEESLPKLDEFLMDWIAFLKEKTPNLRVGTLLREAVFLKGGIPAISEFARTYATQFPIAYIDWIHALEREGDKDAALQAATEGLSNIPGDYVARADVAEKLAMIGIERQDNQLKLKGFRERFYSNPALDHLLDLYITAGEVGCFEETKEKAEKRLTELREKGETAVHTYVEIERRHAQVYEGDFIHALLLNGHHEDVFQMCKGKGVLGWSSSAHPKPVMLTFLMDLLSGEKKYTNMLNKQWEYAVNRMFYGHRETMMKKYNKIMKDVLSTVHLTEEQDKRYLEWCKNETGKRVDAIVSNKYRGSYDKAANILVAMGESLANRGHKQDGLQFVEKYQSKYSRFPAFRKEVARALKVSGL